MLPGVGVVVAREREPGLKNDKMAQSGMGPGATPGGNFTGAATLLALAGVMGWLFFVQPTLDGLPFMLDLTILGVAMIVPTVGVAGYLIWYGARRLRWRRRNAALTGGVDRGLWGRTPGPGITSHGPYPAWRFTEPSLGRAIWTLGFGVLSIALAFPLHQFVTPVAIFTWLLCAYGDVKPPAEAWDPEPQSVRKTAASRVASAGLICSYIAFGLGLVLWVLPLFSR